MIVTSVQRRGSAVPFHDVVMDAELLAAIIFVLRSETETRSALDHQRITFRGEDEQAAWTTAGLVRSFARRR